jgi:hypothetical protein
VETKSEVRSPRRLPLIPGLDPMHLKQSIFTVVMAVSFNVFAATTRSSPPEEVVAFYLDAVHRESVREMLSVRDLHRQAYSDLYEALGREPDQAAVELRASQLEKMLRRSFAPPKLAPRTCSSLSTRYESATVAQVTGLCDRDLGGGHREQSIVDVVLALTKVGWRIVNSGADE